jgi:hypothetical protein
MNNSDQNASEGDIRGIRSDVSERILALWRIGKTLREIGEELNLPIKIVKRILKERQKTLIQKGSLKL